MTDTISINSNSLIAADRVDGTTVYDLKGDKLGSVDDLMIDKVSGRTIYAVLSFGGFLGIGEKHFPLPWSSLKYDTDLGGYRVNVTEEQIKGAPSYERDADYEWNAENGRRVDAYYRGPNYWE